MLGKRKNTAGLYIGSQKSVLAKLQRVGSKQVTIDQLEIVDTPPEVFNSDDSLNVTVLSKLIRDLIANSGIKAQEIALSIPSRHNIVIRNLTIPSMSKREMREALRSEVENYAPLSSDEPVLDFLSIGQTFEETKQKIEIVLSAAPKGLIRAYLAAIGNINLKLSLIEPSLLSVLRTIIPPELENDESEDSGVSSGDSTMLVCLEDDNGMVAIVKNNTIRFTYTLEFGRKSLDDASAFSELATNLNSSITYYQSNLLGQVVEKIILFTDGSDCEDICVRLGELVDVPISTPVLPQTLDESTREVLKDNQLSVFSAIGSAMHNKGEDAINLMPTRGMETVNVKKQVFVGALVVFSTLLLSVSSTFVFKAITKTVVQKTSSVVREREVINEGIAMVGVESEVAKLRSQIDLAKRTLNSITAVEWIKLLPELRMVIPKAIWLSNLSWQENDNLVLSGSALSYDSVFKFIDTLKASPYFAYPEFTFVRKSSSEGKDIMQFEIRCKVISKKLGEQEVKIGVS
jgi:type IV pilus assembly protein PilM